MISVRRFVILSFVAIGVSATATFAAASADDTFPAHVRLALAAYDGAARLIVDGRYNDAVAALEGLGESLAEPYSTKAAAAARKLQETVVKPRFDARSSYLRSRQRTRAAEVCLDLHAYREAAEIFEQAARDAALVIRDDAKIEVVRRAFRHAGSDVARFRDLFERCRAVDPEIYTRRLLERDEQSAARRRSSDPLAELIDDLPAELPQLGFEEFHWLRLRRLSDAWPESAKERLRIEPLLGESIAGIGDWSNLRTSTVPRKELPYAVTLRTTTPVVAANPFQTSAPTSSPEAALKNEADRETAAQIMQMLEVDRVDAAVTLCRELIRTGSNPDDYFPAVLRTAEVLVESGRFDQALQLYGALILTPLPLRAHWNRAAAIAAYSCSVRRGNPQ
jgi:hypothetical protein